ncbi:hypothetical protein [Sandaracinus amylolyticus]|uniref:Uncharacterized protein n=1 Tax=Sandaracinus amylolyticus TaxID=927083 RepID=A0A0F6W8H1_9BACT|nr:hypothetical protein [Sandaracinus amylolyticus]AKF10002.1 hypothetical protein DB32_007151 [Sandaracinus amylolyticus]
MTALRDVDPELARAARDRLARAQEPSPHVAPGLVARGIIGAVDAVYGSEGSFPKFRALEVIARVMYQAWESVAYGAISSDYRDVDARSGHARTIERSRHQQDNEQRHLFWMHALCERRGEREGWWRHRVVPRVLAALLYRLAWIAHWVDPAWSLHLNAELEDRAEREYLRFLAAHPELEHEPAGVHGFTSVADLLRSMVLDEREHKTESLAHAARLGELALR